MPLAALPGGRRKASRRRCSDLPWEKAAEAEQELRAAANLFPAPEMAENSCVGFSTPKARRFRISDELPCPPAPKKRRLAAVPFSSGRPSVPFFTHPDMELFFLLALHDLST
ncbi:hypothetical protein AXF42_Ash012964 [Apostasia shenzhenica]|uniref:Uncharacterized protein n=1 Tax=Apostasia shenzhenica TaxID=1088818 RepID=A0A2I0ARR0_9ASPA|nr:hypothetical protein AXF42_Ash012964 [Apostasia shenzhenica]